MKTYVHLENTLPDDLPAALRDDDVRYPENLVAHFLEAHTREGDLVFDPFAGFGTTLLVAERMGRVPYGIEIDPARVDYVRSKLRDPEAIVHGDSRRLAALDLPPIDFSMTSPPYMNRDDADDPLSGYSSRSKGYARYLQDIRSVYADLRRHMKQAGTVVVEAANLKRAGGVTTLAWDIANEVSKVLRFDGEVVVCWDRYGYGYDHSYCLVFSAL